MGKLGLSKLMCSVLVFCAATAITSPAQTFTTLVSFDGTDGSQPFLAPLVQGTSGQLYGTTGVSYNNTVFSITAGGKLTTLYTFCSQPNCSDGDFPLAGLAQSTSGTFYGTTSHGGDLSCGIVDGCGTIFEITPAGKLTTLYTFCAQTNCTDGAYPRGTLVRANNGNLYGTTFFGGDTNAGYCYGNECGTVFEITPAGKANHTLYLLLPNELHRRCKPGRRARASHQRQHLWNNIQGRS